jgi:hypothetical protein
MRRAGGEGIGMKRRLFKLLTGLSLLLCVAACVLWVWTRRHSGFVGRVGLGDRYSFFWDAGAVGLFGPPPPAADPRVRKAAADAVAALRNEQVLWEGYYPAWSPFGVSVPKPLAESPAEFAEAHFVFGDLARPLLEALDDPSRFVAAHVLLVRKASEAKLSEPPLPTFRRIPGKSLGPCESDYGDGEHQLTPQTEVDYAGLRLIVSRRAYPEHTARGYASNGTWYHPIADEADAEQIPGLRDQWRGALDVRLAWAPYRAIVAATAALPLASLGWGCSRRLVSRRRAARGLCERCGYDLTGNVSGACPECGTRKP